MNVEITQGNILKMSADLLIVGLYEDHDTDPFINEINEALHGRLKKQKKVQNFTGKVGEHMLFSAPENFDAEFLLVLGLGKLDKDPMEQETLLSIGGRVTAMAKQLGTSTIAMECLGEDHEAFQAKHAARGIITGALLNDYAFRVYKQEEKQFAVKKLTLVCEDSKDAQQAKKVLPQLTHVIDGVNVARDLVNTPAKDMTPTRLAEAAREIAKNDARITVKVLSEAECKKRGMHAYLAVSQGSDEPGKFIHLTYKPKKKANKRIALVGKGVTFDSGGLSLKPGNYMETMKCDMAGSAAVIGTFAALKNLDIACEVHGVIAATENMPSGKAIRPGDVVKASNGKTIEILNTDAEGRLTLADALVYAQEQKPDVIVDLATLTGACVVALGEEIAAVMANNSQVEQDLLIAAKTGGESLWAMPLPKRYAGLLKSPIADMRNISTSRYGGSLTAGLFLQNFIEEGQKWAHMDIAGPAFAERPIGGYLTVGGTGYGVRTLVEFIQSQA